MDIDALQRMLERGRDSAMLRFTLGTALAKAKRHEEAVQHLEQAVVLDPHYSAAWQAMGRSLERLGERSRALQTYRRGLEVARGQGDMQVARALEVFVRRLERNRP